VTGARGTEEDASRRRHAIEVWRSSGVGTARAAAEANAFGERMRHAQFQLQDLTCPRVQVSPQCIAAPLRATSPDRQYGFCHTGTL
jgi:hypothetical protein